jgi:hypothetical protein
LDGVKADIYSRPNSLNGRYTGKPGEGTAGTKLDIGTGEEAYPTSWPSKIPVFGRFFKASEVAYEAGAIRLRADIADKVYSMTEKTGKDMTENKTVGDINAVINGITGRIKLTNRTGELENKINTMFFSVKFFKSNLDYLTLHQFRYGKSPATKLAATNLLYTVAATGIILSIAQALNPDDNKNIFNPTSSNFGKIKVGNMTFDLTHGAGGIVVLAAKLLTQKSTSASTGVTSKLGSGYGAQTGMDVLWNFTENKFSPLFSALKEIINQRTFEGNKPTLIGQAGSLVTPILIGNIIQFEAESLAMRVIGLIADGLGINTNVFTSKTDWGETEGKELLQFRAVVGDDKFNEANDKFDQEYNKWLGEMRSDVEYQSLSDEDKKAEITKQKAKIKKDIFTEYDFKYDKEKEIPLEPLTLMERIKGFIGIPVTRKAYNTAGVVMAERMDLATSNKIKKTMMEEMNIPWDQHDNYKLDHTLPLQMCDKGNVQCNAQSNLRVVTTDVWKSYTPVENRITKLYKQNKITLKQAQDLIYDMKSGRKTVQELLDYNP